MCNPEIKVKMEQCKKLHAHLIQNLYYHQPFWGPPNGEAPRSCRGNENLKPVQKKTLSQRAKTTLL